MTPFTHPRSQRLRWQRLRGFHKDQAGSGLVEFALSLSVLMLVIFGIMDMSRALYADHYVSEMAREATRYAIVRGSTWASSCASTTSYGCYTTNTNVSNFVKSITPLGVSTSHVTVTTTWPGTKASGSACITTSGTNSPGCIVTSLVSYSYNFVLPFMSKKTLTLTSTSSMTILQ